jgi:carboxylesterase type B
MAEFIVVDTEYGKVKGVSKTSALSTAFAAFVGIRYAKPPVGDLRFKVSAKINREEFQGHRCEIEFSARLCIVFHVS